MTGPSFSRHHREIGEVVAVTSVRVVIEIHEDLTSPVHSYPGGQAIIAHIGAYIVFPIGAGESVIGVIIAAYQNEGYEPDPHSGMTLQLSKPRRTVHANLLGTIGSGDRFRHGVAVFPTLGSPALVPSTKQLEAILDASRRAGIEPCVKLELGASPIYQTIGVSVSLDDLFSRPLALVGNTGSGKSWTVASAVQRCLDALQPREHYQPKFIILDINGEYGQAFEREHPTREPNHVYANDAPFTLPVWAFDLNEMAHYFGASVATQMPVLERIVTFAREDSYDTALETTDAGHPRLIRRHLRDLQKAREFLRSLTTCARTTEGPYVGTKARTMYEYLSTLIPQDGELADIWTTLPEYARNSVQELQTDLEQTELLQYVDVKDRSSLRPNEVKAPYDALPHDIAQLIERLREVLDPLLEQLHETLLLRAGLPTITADSPHPFEPARLDHSDLFDLALAGMRGEQRIHEYVATLRLRIRRMLQDRRWSVFRQHWDQQFHDLLAQLTRADEPGDPIVILDCSMLAHDVLPFFCAVVGRLLLDVREHADPQQRIARPWVLVLEEAHNYLRPRREGEDPGLTLSRQAFERIAKEGRKFGMSLIIASQRPSDVSDTVLSQCANFIVHRIQNPDDIDYFKRILPVGSRDMLDQVSILSPGEALLLGSAVNVPCRVRVWKPNPTPHSDTPTPSQHWKTEAVFDLQKAIANRLGQQDIGHD